MRIWLFLWLTSVHARALGPWLDDEPTDTDTDVAEEWAPTLPEVDLPRCDSSNARTQMQLPEREGLYRRIVPDTAWGTPYLNQSITAVAEEMAFLRPEADPMVIGDLSRRGGGYLSGHKSHDNGLDADIGLFRGRGIQGNAFVDLTSSTIDMEANWLMIRAMLDTGRVKFILLDQSLINAMRSWLLKNEVLPKEEVDEIFPLPGTPRTWEMDGIVRHAEGHRNHLHLRVRCD